MEVKKINLNEFNFNFIFLDTFQCGGWGHAIGDEGGAYWHAYRAVKTIFDHEDNLVKCPYETSTTWELIKNHFEIETRPDMLEYCYAKFQKSFYAKLCQKMAIAALNGDELCKNIFFEGGQLLARMIIALIPRASKELISNTGYLSIICVGSVWLSWDLLKQGFIKELHCHEIPFELRLLKLRPGISMAVGSIYMAADHVNFSLPRDYSKNYQIFFSFGGGKHSQDESGNCLCCISK